MLLHVPRLSDDTVLSLWTILNAADSHPMALRVSKYWLIGTFSQVPTTKIAIISTTIQDITSLGVISNGPDFEHMSFLLPTFCTIVGLPEEPPIDRHVQYPIPVYQLIRLHV